MAQLQIFLPDVGQVTHDLTEEKVTVGRLADNTLHLDDISVSSRHAEIALEDGIYHVRDLDSTNGTFVNEEKIMESALTHGDEIRFGSIPVVFVGDDMYQSSQPLPESTGLLAEVAATSARPAGFTSSSPIPKTTKESDPIGMAAYAVSGLALAAFVGALAMVLLLATPA